MADEVIGEQTQESAASESGALENGSTLMTGDDEQETQTETDAGDDTDGGSDKLVDKPEPYELEAPEGYPIPADKLKSLTAHFNEIGLTREQAEKQIEYMSRQYAEFQESQKSQRSAWISEIKGDKEFGGEKFKETVADAKRALAQFDDDGSIRGMLNETGYGDNPAIIKIFAKVGRALAEDRIIGKAREITEKPLEERLYPNM